MRSSIFTKYLLMICTGVVLGVSLLAPSDVYAEKTVTWSTVIPQSLYYYWDRFNGSSDYQHGYGWAQALGPNTSVNVTYRVKVTNFLTGQEVPDGATVFPGSELLFQREAPQTGDVSWFGTGNTQDSPNGYVSGYNASGTNATNEAIFKYAEGPVGDTVSCDPQSYIGTYNVNSVISFSGGSKDISYGTTNSFPTYISLVFGNAFAYVDFFNHDTASPDILNDYNTFMNDAFANGNDNSLGGTRYNTIDMSPYLSCEDYCANGYQAYGDCYTKGSIEPLDSYSDSDSILCTVLPVTSTTTQSLRTFSANFDFAQTTGSFYYRYYDNRNLSWQACSGNGCEQITQGPGCYGNNDALAPLAEASTSNALGFDSYFSNQYYQYSRWLDSDGTEGDTFQAAYDGGLYEPPLTITVPAQRIPYTFYIAASDTPPLSPVVTGPTALNAVTSLQGRYTAVATDPDALPSGNPPPSLGDRVRYGFDWNNDGIVDQWVPTYYEYGYNTVLGSGPVLSHGMNFFVPEEYEQDYVQSGVAQTVPHTWTSVGTSTFKVLTQDDQGLLSPWSSPYSTVVTSPVPVINFYYYGDDAHEVGTSSTYSDSQGDTPYLQWSTQYATTCQLSGSSTLANAGTYGSQNVPTLASIGQDGYTMTCVGAGGTTTKAITVNVGAEPPPTISLSIDGTGDWGTASAYSDTDNYAYWDVTHAASCTASASPSNDNWSGSVGYDPYGNYQDLGTLPIGTYSYTISCQNAEGETSTDTVPLTVQLAPPSVSCLTSANELTSGYTTYVPSGTDVTYTANPSGGTPPYTYSWDGYSYDQNWDYSNDGLSGTDSTLDTTYNRDGYHYADVTITDANGQIGYGSCADQNGNGQVLVDNPPTTPIVTGPTVGQPDVNYTFTAVSTDPDPNAVLTYSFIPNDDYWPDWYFTYYDYPEPAQGNSISDANWSTPAIYNVGAIAVDDWGVRSAEGFASPITIGDAVVPPDICSANLDPAATGQPVTWTVSTSSSSPAFAWSGTDNLNSSLYQASIAYSTVGTKSASVDVTSNGITHSVDCGSITVNTGLPKIDLSGSTGGAYTYGLVVLSKTAPLQVKLSVSNALSCTASGDPLWAPHVNGLDLSSLTTTPDISPVSSPLSKSETLSVTCGNANGSITSTLHVGVLSIVEF